MLAVTDVSSWKLSLKKVKVVCRDESVLSLWNNERSSRDMDMIYSVQRINQGIVINIKDYCGVFIGRIAGQLWMSLKRRSGGSVPS